MAVIRIGDSVRRGTRITSRDPRLRIGAYITDGVRLLRALGERDNNGRWAYENCVYPFDAVKLTVGEVAACTLIAPAQETESPLASPAP